MPTHDPPPRTSPARLRRAVAVASWAYLGLALAAWLAIRTAGDRWWGGSVLLFGPRWVWAAPLAPLLPAAAALRRRSILPLALAAVVAAGPVMGLRLNLAANPSGRPSLRILTCNVHGGAADARAMKRLIAEQGPDVVVLQECSARWLLESLPDPWWSCYGSGEQFVASRFTVGGAREVSDRAGGIGFCGRFELRTPAGVVPLYNLHLQSPHEPLRALLHGEPAGPARVRANIAARDEQSAAASAAAAADGGAVVVAGDFNMPCDGVIYRRWWGRFPDAFGQRGAGLGYTYRVRWTAARIDHVLAGAGWRCRDCRVLPDVGSPHRPLLVELEAAGGAAAR